MTGGVFKTRWTEDGLFLIMNIDPRVPQPSEFGDLPRALLSRRGQQRLVDR